MVGAVSTIWGKDKVNIADMSLSRLTPGSTASWSCAWTPSRARTPARKSKTIPPSNWRSSCNCERQLTGICGQSWRLSFFAWATSYCCCLRVPAGLAAFRLPHCACERREHLRRSRQQNRSTNVLCPRARQRRAISHFSWMRSKGRWLPVWPLFVWTYIVCLQSVRGTNAYYDYSISRPAAVAGLVGAILGHSFRAS